MPNPSLVAFKVSEIPAFIRTDEHGQIDLAYTDQEYIYFIVSDTLPSTHTFTLRVTGIKTNFLSLGVTILYTSEIILYNFNLKILIYNSK